MQLFYKEYPGPGQPLIIMHGLFGMLDNWHNLARSFSENYHVFLVDLRNHGQSPHSSDFSYPLMAADIAELMQHLGLSKAAILGHSMGGKVAMEFALENPEKCSELIVVDIAPVQYRPGHDDIFAALFSIDLKDGTRKRSELDEEMAKYIPEFGTRQFLLKSLVRDGDGFAWKFNLDALHHHYEKIIAGIEGARDYTGPTLFIRGSESRYVRDEHWSRIEELFPLAKLSTVEGAGHWVHAEKPQELIQLVKEFLR